MQIDLQPNSLQLKRSEENEPLIDKIKENTRLLSSKFRPQLMRWLAVLSKSGADVESLKAVIDIKQRLENALRKATTLGINIKGSSDTNSASKKRAKSTAEEDESSDDEFVDVSEVDSTDYQGLVDMKLAKMIVSRKEVVSTSFSFSISGELLK